MVHKVGSLLEEGVDRWFLSDPSCYATMLKGLPPMRNIIELEEDVDGDD